MTTALQNIICQGCGATKNVTKNPLETVATSTIPWDDSVKFGRCSLCYVTFITFFPDLAWQELLS